MTFSKYCKEIKEYFSIDLLSESQSKSIMELYLKATPIKKAIEILEEKFHA